MASFPITLPSSLLSFTNIIAPKTAEEGEGGSKEQLGSEQRTREGRRLDPWFPLPAVLSFPGSRLWAALGLFPWAFQTHRFLGGSPLLGTLEMGGPERGLRQQPLTMKILPTASSALSRCAPAPLCPTRRSTFMPLVRHTSLQALQAFPGSIRRGWKRTRGRSWHSGYPYSIRSWPQHHPRWLQGSFPYLPSIPGVPSH